jgi:hypothetical protein
VALGRTVDQDGALAALPAINQKLESKGLKPIIIK